MSRSLPRVALTPVKPYTTTQQSIAMNNDTQTLSNKELADKISDLIDLTTTIISVLDSGAITPHEASARRLVLLADNELANLLEYFHDQKGAEAQQEPKPEKSHLDVFYDESFKITALGKVLVDWFLEQKVDPKLGPLDMDCGDYLEVACMIITSSKLISDTARDADKVTDASNKGVLT